MALHQGTSPGGVKYTWELTTEDDEGGNTHDVIHLRAGNDLYRISPNATEQDMALAIRRELDDDDPNDFDQNKPERAK